jgi:iron uptake system component EfeO
LLPTSLAGPLLGAAAALTLAACGGDDSASESAPEKAGAQVVNVELSDAACVPDRDSVAAGPVTFEVTNAGAKVVTEFEIVDAGGVVIGERENLADGTSGSFTLNLEPGRYVAKCPDAKTEERPFSVTGGAAAAADTQLDAATAGWKKYVEAQSTDLLARTREFARAVRDGDVQRAKDLFATARAPYERIEPVAESFGDLDPKIDARVNDVAEGTPWTGFHRIEQGLWVTGTTAGLGPLAERLVRDVTRLHDQIPALDFQAAQLANGAVELLNEVAKSKISGEEDRYSHTDLADFQSNLEGAHEAYRLLRPALAQRGAADLAAVLEDRFADVEHRLSRYRRPAAASGWAPYGALTAADRRALSQAIDALAEPLSTVAARVAA